jgi:hypothetical protein
MKPIRSVCGTVGHFGLAADLIGTAQPASILTRLCVRFGCDSTKLGVFQAARARANTNPNGTEANALGRSVRACVARESKFEESCGVGGRAMCLMGGRGAGKCGSEKHSYEVA